jgi:hypothetical protein
MFSIFINKFKQAPESDVKTIFSIRLFFFILSLPLITLSCGSGAYEPEQNNSQSIYPHATTFADPDSHGLFTLANDINVCASCHGDDFQGGASLTSCFECHPPYPHAQEWKQPVQHGAFTLDIGVGNCSIACHGENFSGKGTATSCYSCHPPYPHNADWINMSNSTNHGKYYVNNINDSCAIACHGDNFSGKGAAKSCFECHTPYPHNADWTNMNSPSDHGRFYVESYILPNTSNAECATACHGEDFSGGSTSISCDSVNCHDAGVFPHLDEGQILWGATGHQIKVNTFGSDDQCIICHSDYKKGAFGGTLITCTTYCHQ